MMGDVSDPTIRKLINIVLIIAPFAGQSSGEISFEIHKGFKNKYIPHCFMILQQEKR